jgi:hypothetical protein
MNTYTEQQYLSRYYVTLHSGLAHAEFSFPPLRQGALLSVSRSTRSGLLHTISTFLPFAFMCFCATPNFGLFVLSISTATFEILGRMALMCRVVSAFEASFLRRPPFGWWRGFLQCGIMRWEQTAFRASRKVAGDEWVFYGYNLNGMGCSMLG